MGMLNNPWFRIKIHPMNGASPQGSSNDTAAGVELPRVKFEHPTMAGNVNGGWMMRMKVRNTLSKSHSNSPSNIYE